MKKIIGRDEIVKQFWWRRKSDCLWYSYALQFIVVINIKTHKRDFTKFYFDVAYVNNQKKFLSIKDVDILLKDVAECNSSQLQETWDMLESKYLKQTLDELDVEGKEKLINGF